MSSIPLTRLLLFRIVGLVGHRMFTVYTLSSKLADVMADTRPSPFSPVYYGMQFRAAPPEQPARQITALFASPGTSKRNKDLRHCRDAGMYASWMPMYRKSGNDSV